MNVLKKKLAKNIGLLYRPKQFLDKESRKTIYFSYIHSYLNYANIAWDSTYFTILKTIHYQQKHVTRIIFNEDVLTHCRPLLRSLNALNIYQINLYQHTNVMYKFQKYQTPKILNIPLEKPTHKYPTQFSEANFKYKKFSLTSTKHSISVRGPKILYEFLTRKKKKYNPIPYSYEKFLSSRVAKCTRSFLFSSLYLPLINKWLYCSASRCESPPAPFFILTAF